MSRLSFVCSSLVPALLALSAATPASAQEFTVSACSVADPPAGCKDGMWALRVPVIAPSGPYAQAKDMSCMNDASAEVAKVVQAAGASAQPQLARFSGPLSALAAQPIAQRVKSQGGDLGKLVTPHAKNGTLCAPLVAVVPVAAQVVETRLLAGETGALMQRCPPGADCPIGWSKFQAAPVEAKSGAIARTRRSSRTGRTTCNDRSR